MDLSDAVVMQQQAVKIHQATEGIFRQDTDTIAMQEQVGEVDQVGKEAICKVAQLVLLQVEELQAVELEEKVSRQLGQVAAVHV